MRKRKNGFKKISIKTMVLVILSIFLLTISVGYSYLQQRLTISGKSSISKSNGSGQIINGESTYTWTIINSWGGGSSDYIYQIKIELFNKDEDIEKWQISFDVPDSYNHAGSNIWTAESSSYENGRLTLNAHGWNASIPSGTSISVEFQLAFKEEVVDLVTNLKLLDSTKISNDEIENTTPDLGESEGTTGTEQNGETTPDSGETEGTTGTEQNGETTPDSGETEGTTDSEQNVETTPDSGETEQTTNLEQTDTPVSN